MTEFVVNARLDQKALDLLASKFERLSEIFGEANILLRELSSDS